MLETIRADFVTTARAKGLAERKVIYKHMLPNALIPVISDLGMQLSMIIGGSVVVESVFSFPGIGTYLLTGIQSRDYPVIRSCVLILAVFAAAVTQPRKEAWRNERSSRHQRPAEKAEERRHV